MVEEKKTPDQLKYLDTNLWVTEAHLEETFSNFECIICNGVVLDPVECTTRSCSNLYCQACLG